MDDVTSLGFRTDLMLLRLQGSVVEERAGYRVIHSPANPSHYWGNFLLLERPPEPGSITDWVQIFEREFPEARHVALGVDGTDGELGVPDEIEAHGLRLEVGTVLIASALAEPRYANSDAELRILSTDDDWRQALNLKDATNEDYPVESYHVFAEAYLASKRGLQNRGLGGWFGAFVDGTLVAHLGVFGDGSGVARFQTVETHPAFRRRGYAGSLVKLAGDYALTSLGASRLVIVADPDYVAIGLYRSLGFTGTESQAHIERAPSA